MKNIQTGVTPLLVVINGIKAVEFYKAAFGAREVVRYDISERKVMSKIVIEGSDLWVSDEEPEYNNLCPDKIGGSPVRLVLTVNDPDTVFAAALKAGATQICPVTTEESWRIGKLTDPFGHIWEIGKPLD